MPFWHTVSLVSDRYQVSGDECLETVHVAFCFTLLQAISVPLCAMTTTLTHPRIMILLAGHSNSSCSLDKIVMARINDKIITCLLASGVRINLASCNNLLKMLFSYVGSHVTRRAYSQRSAGRLEYWSIIRQADIACRLHPASKQFPSAMTLNSCFFPKDALLVSRFVHREKSLP